MVELRKKLYEFYDIDNLLLTFNIPNYSDDSSKK